MHGLGHAKRVRRDGQSRVDAASPVTTISERASLLVLAVMRIASRASTLLHTPRQGRSRIKRLDRPLANGNPLLAICASKQELVHELVGPRRRLPAFAERLHGGLLQLGQVRE